MPYLIDRERALRSSELVAVLSLRQRRIRSRAVLRDNSLYHTLTRPGTLRRQAVAGEVAIGRAATMRTKRRTDKEPSRGAAWWTRRSPRLF